jgi:hypothetical protein
MTGDYSVPLSLLKVSILGYIEKDAALLVGEFVWESAGGFFFSPTFLDLVGRLLQADPLNWSHQMSAL